MAGWQLDGEGCPAWLAGQGDAAVVRGDDTVDDGQSEAGVSASVSAGGVAPDESLEYRGLQLGGDARSVVGDGHGDQAVLAAFQLDGYRAAGRGVGARVGEQVGEHLVQPVLVTAEGDRLAGQVEDPLVGGAGYPRVVGGLERQPGEVDQLVGEWAAGVEPGEQQQVV